jgi:hypothetical protein
MNTRPAEPQVLIEWREWVNAGPPKVCHSCEHYDKGGHCRIFDMRPPEEFAATVDACDKWQWEIPF